MYWSARGVAAEMLASAIAIRLTQRMLVNSSEKPLKKESFSRYSAQAMPTLRLSTWGYEFSAAPSGSLVYGPLRSRRWLQGLVPPPPPEKKANRWGRLARMLAVRRHQDVSAARGRMTGESP